MKTHKKLNTNKLVILQNPLAFPKCKQQNIYTHTHTHIRSFCKICPTFEKQKRQAKKCIVTLSNKIHQPLKKQTTKCRKQKKIHTFKGTRKNLQNPIASHSTSTFTFKNASIF
jgi:hypothetical protein